MKKRAFDKGIFAFPYMILSAIFIIFPLVLVLVYAFRGVDGKFTFDNFAQVFTNPTNYMLILKTIGIALITTAICLLIAYPVAFVLASSHFNKHTILALLFIIPMWMNFVLRMYALQSLLNIINVKDSFGAAIIGMVYDYLPFMLLPIYTSLVNMDKSYVEASRDLGGGDVQTFFRITFPLSVPGIISGILMVFMPTFSSYAITDILGGTEASVIGGKINTLFGERLTWGLGSALSFILLVIVIVVMVAGNLITRASNKAKADAADNSIVGGRIR